jgi:hypothetical protein
LCCFHWRWAEQKVSDAKSKQKHNADLGKPLQEIGGASVDAQAAGAASRPSEHLCGLASATERRKGGRWDKESDGLSECRFKSRSNLKRVLLQVQMFGFLSRCFRRCLAPELR